MLAGVCYDELDDVELCMVIDTRLLMLDCSEQQSGKRINASCNKTARQQPAKITTGQSASRRQVCSLLE